MTIVVVGGGPTGVELAGAFAELARIVLKRISAASIRRPARVILIEASPVVLSHMPPDLSASATQQLRVLGVRGPHFDARAEHHSRPRGIGDRRSHRSGSDHLGGRRFRQSIDAEARGGAGSRAAA